MDLEAATMILDKVVAQHCITAGVEAWQTLKAHCTQPTDVQQLKAEIAAIADTFDRCNQVNFRYGIGHTLLTKLRQLSAV